MDYASINLELKANSKLNQKTYYVNVKNSYFKRKRNQDWLRPASRTAERVYFALKYIKSCEFCPKG
jgi:hypothetical protein